MSSEKNYLSVLTFVFSLLGASLLWLLNIWQLNEQLSLLLKIMLWVFVLACWITVFLTIKPLILQKLRQNRFDRSVFNDEKLLAEKLRKLFENNSEQFENRTGSFSSFVNELRNQSAKFPEIYSRLDLVDKQLNALKGWHDSLKTIFTFPIEKSGRNSFYVRVEKAVLFFYALDRPIRDFNSIKFEGESNRIVPSESRNTTFDRYNSCIKEFEDFLKEVQQVHTHKDQHKFVRLENS